MKLQLVAEYQDDAYPEIGEITGLFWNRDHSVFGVVSVRNPGTSWIRPRLYSKHCQRLSLYDAKSKKLLTSTSGFHHPILDVCFHPTDSSIIIGTGAYDGGYSLMGELVLWNWCTNERKILSGFSSFYRTRFLSPTEIEVLLSPECEEDVEAGQDPFKTFRRLSVSLTNLLEGRIPNEMLTRPSAQDVAKFDPDFEPMGMYTDERKQFELTSQGEVTGLLGINGDRGAVVDILSTESHLFTIKNRPVFERRSLNGELLEVIENRFSGAQVFSLGDGRLLVNTDKYEPLHVRSEKIYGRLLIWDGKTRQIETYLEGPNPFLLSQSSDGMFLARSCGHYSEETSAPYRQPMGVDFLIDRHLNKKPTAPLGSANHLIHITTKGSKRLYHLGLEFPWPGWGKKPYPRKVLLTIGADAKSHVLDFDDKRPSADVLHASGRFLGTDLFCAYPTEADEDLIGAGSLANVQPMKSVIWRHDLVKKAWIWQKQFDESVRLLLSVPAHDAVIVGFDNGFLRMLDAVTGDTLGELKLSFAGIPSLPMEACLHGDEVILATLESRILRFRIER
jgi:hypothetical protein